MTDEQMARIIDRLIQSKTSIIYFEFHQQVLEVIRELQCRVAAERRDHEATIKQYDDLLASG